MQPSALLSFAELLDSQLDDTLPYPTLKRLLRSLKHYHPAYPCSQPTASHLCSLSQTQTVEARVVQQPALPPRDAAHHAHRDEHVVCDARAASLGSAGRRNTDQHAQSTPVLADIQNRSPAKRERSEMRAVEHASSLKRRKRHSRRRSLVIATADKENTHLAADLQHHCTLRTSESHTNKTASSKKPTIPRANLKQTHVGEQINSMICELTRQAQNGHNVTWSDLRRTLLTESSRYNGFCVALDKLFVATDPIALCNSPQNSQNSKASRSCIFYSNTFWDDVWNDYVESRA